MTRPTEPSATSIVAHISQLPIEILAQIFQEVLAEHGLEIVPAPNLVDKGEEPHPLVTLGLVCKDWHRYVLDFPELWSWLFIEIDHSVTERSVRYFDLILQRSKQCALEFSVWFEATRFGVKLDQGVAMLRRLFSESYRWRFAALRVDPALLDTFFHVAMQDMLSFPQLEELELEWAYATSRKSKIRKGSIRPSNFLLSLPRLKMLLIDSIFIPTEIEGWSPNITSLTLEGLTSIVDAQRLISHCRKSLEQLSLVFDLIYEDGGTLSHHSDDHLPFVNAPALTSLTCEFDLRERPRAITLYERLLGSLSLPSLDSLVVGRAICDSNGSDNLPHNILNAFSDLFTRSRCSLQELNLKWSMFESSPVPFFRGISTLTHFAMLRNTLVPHHIQQSLIVNPEQDEAPLFPCLSSIELYFGSAEDAKVSLEIIESRLEPKGGRLSSSILRCGSWPVPTSLSEAFTRVQQIPGFTLTIEPV